MLQATVKSVCAKPVPCELQRITSCAELKRIYGAVGWSVAPVRPAAFVMS